jgi:hypothetical protein
MPPERFKKWRNAAVADKCDHHINGVGRSDFRQDLIAHARLTRSVGEQCCIQQRDHRWGDVVRAPVWQPTDYTLQHIARSDRTFRTYVVRRRHLAKEIDEPTGKIESDVRSLTFSNAVDHTLDQSGQMQRDAICSLRRPQRGADWLECSVEIAESLLQRLGDEDFIETAL